MKAKLFLMLILFVPFTSPAQVSLEWSETYRDSSYTNGLVESFLDVGKNIIAIGIETNLQINDDNPYVIKYNSAGILEFHWSLAGTISTYDEVIGGATSDSLGDIYIGSNILSFPVDTGRFIKIDGNTGATDFIISFIDAKIYDIMVQDSFIYVLVGAPYNSIYKYDLSGNYIWDQNLFNPYPFKIFNWNTCIGVIGENSISTSDTYLRIDRYKWNGAYLDGFDINPSNQLELLSDIKIDALSNLWIGGVSFPSSYVPFIVKADSNGIIKDTTISNFQQAGSPRLDVSNEGLAFVSMYTSLPAKYTLYNFTDSLQFFNEIDSGFPPSTANFGLDINAELLNRVITVNSKRYSPGNSDCEITCFDTIGNFLWNYVYAYSPTSREQPFKLLIDQNSMYIVSRLGDINNGIFGTNVFKVNIITGVQEWEPNVKLIIYPNPSLSRSFYLNKQINNATIKIYNITGTKMLEINNFNGNEFSLHNLSSGTYILNIQEMNSSYSQKLILN